MRRLLWIAGTVVGAVVLVVAVAAVAVPYLIDFDAYEHELAAAVRAHTGRELRFQGETRLSLLPRPGLDARQVVLSNPPDFPETAFARAERVEVRLRLLPLLLERRLLTHDVRIGGLRLSLTRNPAGVGNWTDLFPTRGEPDEGGGVPVGLLSGRIEVHDASAHFHDTAGSQYKVTNLHFQSGPVGATPSATELAFDIHGDALAGHLSARARVVRAAADVYRARRATVEAELGPPGAVRPARLVLATEAELDAATGVLVFKELQLEAPNVGVAGVRAETSARAGATLDLARGVLHVDGVDLSANLFGQRVPGGATELTARGALALDLSTDTWWARNIRLRLPALVGRGVAGNVSARAEAAGDLGRRTFSVNDLSVAAEFGGARVPGGALSLRADARLEGDMKERRLQVRALHVAGAGLDMRGALSVAGPWSDPRITDGTLRVAPFAPRIILERLTQRQILTPDPGALGEVALATGVSGSAA
ncbi:MAG: AsmA family protein, partial [Gammaproteobacteria bacterium]|nr:AsmA family protein [Gammaproteobacteria bacterium]NIR84519.1 AsmA family protein [Gammaproteobacteria bacterium]NIR90422.1 AsmA family protein [Gammaproteobacteria bacterium]NIU05570.1 AsmA family protein [Gammaproteobacteria bacterium]NIV52709.1 AsmA family protein [Gammaproteobacteria bacterium]